MKTSHSQDTIDTLNDALDAASEEWPDADVDRRFCFDFVLSQVDAEGNIPAFSLQKMIDPSKEGEAAVVGWAVVITRDVSDYRRNTKRLDDERRRVRRDSLAEA